MTENTKVKSPHLQRTALVYVRHYSEFWIIPSVWF